MLDPWLPIRDPWPRQAIKRVGRGQQLAAAVGAAFEFNLALRKPLWPDQYLPRNTDQVGADEFRSRPLFEIVVENLDALRTKLAVQALGCRVGRAVALLKLEDRNPEWRHCLRPFDAGIIMESLDDSGDEPRLPDAVRTHLDRVLGAGVPGNHRPHP